MMTFVSTLITKYKSIDARWFQFINNVVLLTLGMLSFSLRRPFEGILAGVIISAMIEFLLSPYFRKDRASRSTFDRILSLFNTTISITLIIRSSSPWFYTIAIPVGILSKQLILKNGKHIFNPANFGIVFTLALFGSTTYQFMNNQFILYFVALVITIVMGILIVVKAGRFTLTMTYLAATSLLVYLFAPLFGFGRLELLGVNFSAAGLLYAFFMLPDPKTTPGSLNGQILFGLATAVVSSALRLNQILHDPFIALFVVTAIYSALPQEEKTTVPAFS